MFIIRIVNEAIRRLGPAMRVYPPRDKIKDINSRFDRAKNNPEFGIMEPADVARQLIEDGIKAGYTCGLCKAFAEILTIGQDEGTTNLKVQAAKDKLLTKLKKYGNTTEVYKQAISDIIEDMEN